MLYRRVFGYPNYGLGSSFSQMDRLRRQMAQLMAAHEGDDYRDLPAGVFPMINLTEDRDNYYVRAELPGVKPEQLDIQADGKSLSISGERMIEAEGSGVKYHRKERESGKFSRIISLPGDIEPDKVEASLNNGVLKVVVPKAEALKPRQIQIK